MNVTSNDAQSRPKGGPRLKFRRAFASAAVAVIAVVLVASLAAADSSAPLANFSGSRPSGLGSVGRSPGLPPGFSDTFEDRFVDANGIRQHVVIGGEGPPLLLIHGWPENWYAWRNVMPELAKSYTVIAVDQRGIGLTQKTNDGYDSATLASDLAALMTKLGYDRFAVVGHDTGMVIGYALAADHRDRVVRLAVAEVPGPPTVKDSPPAFIDAAHNDKLWHISFNRVDDDLILDMVSSNANAYYRYEYAVQGGGTTPPENAIKYYIRLYTRDRTALKASFGFYRAWDDTTAQNAARKLNKLTIPVLAIGGANSWNEAVGGAMSGFASDVQTAVVPDAGHWVAEQNPGYLISALTTFLEPYRAGR